MVNLTPKYRVNLICNFFHPKFDFQPHLVEPFCRAVNLTEWGKSVKAAPNEVKFASIWLWSSFSNLRRANKIIVEIHAQQNSPHGFTVNWTVTNTSSRTGRLRTRLVEMNGYENVFFNRTVTNTSSRTGRLRTRLLEMNGHENVFWNWTVTKTSSRTGRLRRRLLELDGYEDVFSNWTVNVCWCRVVYSHNVMEFQAWLKQYSKDTNYYLKTFGYARIKN